MKSAIQDSVQGARITGGYTTAAGVAAGSPGYQVSRTGAGIYSVRIQGAKAILAATANITGAGAGFGVVTTITQPDTFEVRAYSAASALVDANFSFTATYLPR